MEKISGTAEDARLHMQAHRVTLTLVAQMQPNVISNVLLSELF